jgi:type I restriction enzyme M protein
MKLAQILRDTNYKLTQFSNTQIQNLENQVIEKESKGKITYKVVCLVRKKEVVLTPEEVVRQLYLIVLTEQYYYPLHRVKVEHEISMGREKKRADIVVINKENSEPYIIIEVKKPKEKDGKEQLKSYCHATGATMGIWTNGQLANYFHRKDPNYFEKIDNIPNANQKLADILKEH